VLTTASVLHNRRAQLSGSVSDGVYIMHYNVPHLNIIYDFRKKTCFDSRVRVLLLNRAVWFVPGDLVRTRVAGEQTKATVNDLVLVAFVVVVQRYAMRSLFKRAHENNLSISLARTPAAHNEKTSRVRLTYVEIVFSPFWRAAKFRRPGPGVATTD